MKFSTTAAALSTAVLASAQTTTVSEPFNLVAFSEFGPFNNQPLSTCHSGAGIEAICLLKNNTAVFHQNTTTYTGNPGSGSGVAGDSAPGILTWTLDAQPSAVSQAMGLYPVISTNAAQAFFGLSPTTPVAFDKNGYLNIISAYNDVVSPPTFENNTAYYRWQICQTNFEGYLYDTLNWIYGDAKPQNPSCHPVQVKRVFTPKATPYPDSA